MTTPISPLPTPPIPADAPADFNTKAFALLGALPAFVAQANAQASGLDASVAAAEDQAIAAATKAGEALTSANNAAISKTNADAARDAAVIAKNAAEAALDAFDDRYLGAKAVAPTLDNDGNALLIGALYWDTALPGMRSWNGSAWITLPAATAASMANTPAGGISATTVQAAINELDAEKAPLTGTGTSGNWPISISGSASGLSGRAVLGGATGHDYHNSALEVRGDGGTLVPAIGFYQPGKYAGVLQQQGDGYFAFLNQGLSAYQSLRVAELLASGNVTAYSDIRLKTDIEKIPDALNKVTSLNGYTYTRTDTGVRQTGVIAQELLEVLPEAVSTAGEHMSVAYGNMAGLLIEAIKELNEKVTVLTARVAELETR